MTVLDHDMIMSACMLDKSHKSTDSLIEIDASYTCILGGVVRLLQRHCDRFMASIYVIFSLSVNIENIHVSC